MPRSQGFIPEPHGDDFLGGRDVFTVTIEQSRDHPQHVAVPPVDLRELHLLQIHVRHHGQFCVGFADLEELRVQLHRKLVHLLPRKQRLLDFPLRFFGRVLQMRRSVVAAPRLERELRRLFESDLQRVKPAVEFQILWREAEHVVELRPCGDPLEPGLEIVAIVEKRAPGARRHFRQHIGLNEGARVFVLQQRCQDSRVGRQPTFGSVYADVIDAPRVQSADDHARARSAVHDLGLLLGAFRREESRRNEDHRAAARHHRYPPDDVFQHSERKPGFMLARVQDIHRRHPGSLLGHFGVLGRIQMLADDHLLRGNAERLRVVFVHDQVGHVVADVRTFLNLRPGDGPRPQAQERLVQLRPVVGEIEHRLARGRIDRGPAARFQRRVQVPAGRVSRLGQVAELQVHVVEQEGDETVRCHKGLFVVGFRSRLGGGPSLAVLRFLDREGADHLRFAAVE